MLLPTGLVVIRVLPRVQETKTPANPFITISVAKMGGTVGYDAFFLPHFVKSYDDW